jgi:hypothetical protein
VNPNCLEQLSLAPVLFAHAASRGRSLIASLGLRAPLRDDNIASVQMVRMLWVVCHTVQTCILRICVCYSQTLGGETLLCRSGRGKENNIKKDVGRILWESMDLIHEPKDWGFSRK